MAWLGYRITEQTFTEKVRDFFKTGKVIKRRVEMCLVTIKNSSDFHAYSVNKENGGISSSWHFIGGWKFVHITISNIRQRVNNYSRYKYDELADMQMTEPGYSCTYDVHLVASVLGIPLTYPLSPEDIIDAAEKL